MKCDRCDAEATVHEVMIKGGKRHERHLCESCAKSDGINVQAHTPITALLTQYITSQTQGAGGAAGGGALAPVVTPATNLCPTCGLTHQQFRQGGLLGCPHCYGAFEGQLGPLLQRAHDGGTHHVGKKPARLREARPAGVKGAPASVPPAASAGVAAAEREKRVAGLRTQLEAAIAAEQYERAAQLRDELARLETGPRLATKKAAVSRPAVSGEGAGGVGGSGGGA